MEDSFSRACSGTDRAMVKSYHQPAAESVEALLRSGVDDPKGWHCLVTYDGGTYSGGHWCLSKGHPATRQEAEDRCGFSSAILICWCNSSCSDTVVVPAVAGTPVVYVAREVLFVI